MVVMLIPTRKPIIYVNIGSANVRRFNMLYSSGFRNFMATSINELLWLHSLRNRYGINIMVDNGTFEYGHPDVHLIALGRRLGYPYVMPDVIENYISTIDLHMKYKELYGERAYPVLQGRIGSEYIRCLEVYEKLFGHIKRVAVGGLLLKPVSDRNRILANIREVFEGHIHSLGWCKSTIPDSCDISVMHLPKRVRGV